MTTEVITRSSAIEGAEISWFAPICNGDFQYMGQFDDHLKSTWDNCSRIAKTADDLGFRNLLCPSSYQVGQDTLSFVAALAPQLKQMNLLAAVRCGEVHPPMLARAIATIDHMAKGKLTINIISSHLPGTQLSSEARYNRSSEVIQILKQAWTRDEIHFKGEYYQFDHLDVQAVKPYQQNGGPLLYFGGYSSNGVDLCAKYCDVYLMWPETMGRLKELMTNMATKAADHNRVVDFGLRVHVIVRKTEIEARGAAKQLMSKLEAEQGDEIRNRALDAKSYGVSRQAEMRDQSDNEGFVEDLLWTGIGRARSGCGAALVGDPDQIIEKIRRYMRLGIKSFIFSGYPHLAECRLFAKYVLPELKTISLPEVQQRIPASTPETPLGIAKRK